MVAILCWTLHVNQVFFGTEFIYLFLLHFPLVNKIWLVTYEKEDGILFCVGLDFVHPKFAHVFKAERVCQVEYEKNSLAASIVGTCDGSKPFLACGVPDLKFHIFPINLDRLEPEVHSDGGQVMLWKLIFYKSNEYSWLAHSWVPYYDSFVKMIKLFYHIFRINNYKFQGYSCAPYSFTPSCALRASSCSAKIFSSDKNFFMRVYSFCIRFLYSFSLAFSYLLSVIAFLLVFSTYFAQECYFTMTCLAAYNKTE